MRRRLSIGFSVAAAAVTLLAVAGSAAAPSVPATASVPASASIHPRITVKPRTGSPGSGFVIRFRSPVTTGTVGSVRREFVLSLGGPSGAAGCVAEGSWQLPASRAHASVKLTLRPQRFGGPRWCPGTFHAEIHEIEAPNCPPRQLCPALVVLVGSVGTFSFRVAPPGGDRTPPTFAGLTRAIACTPGAGRPGQTTPATLSWSAARDNRTRASKLVYDVFMANTPGAEDFLKPTWTTSPGATSFHTPGLPSHGTAYFVVRGRDQAGNEDANRVERRPIHPCL